MQATTTINARLQATMPGKREECCAMLSVSIGALCFTFCELFFVKIFVSLRSWFPIERFPNNSESVGYTSHKYAIRKAMKECQTMNKLVLGQQVDSISRRE